MDFSQVDALLLGAKTLHRAIVLPMYTVRDPDYLSLGEYNDRAEQRQRKRDFNEDSDHKPPASHF